MNFVHFGISIDEGRVIKDTPIHRYITSMNWNNSIFHISLVLYWTSLFVGMNMTNKIDINLILVKERFDANDRFSIIEIYIGPMKATEYLNKFNIRTVPEEIVAIRWRTKMTNRRNGIFFIRICSTISPIYTQNNQEYNFFKQ
jgi:hypothetical protein